MKATPYIFAVMAFSFAIACSTDNTAVATEDTNATTDDPTDTVEETEEPEVEDVVVSYTADDTDFPNPDRGFYRYSETKASNFTALDESQLMAYRTPSMPSGANYETLSTLVFRYYVLDAFTNESISADFLDKMNADFSIARSAGVKLIPRFTYTITANSGTCPAGFICPPYGDARKEVMLGHIAQLGPILTENIDVINCVQMGLIGTWGENYYTDFFGDASNNADQGKLLDENWEDRIAILKALLDATPKDLMIQVRYPQMKQRYVYGVNAPTTSEPLSSSEAFTEEDKARIGFHNDCLFASADDFGTYTDYGNSSSESLTDTDSLKPYFAADGKYVIVGGETCNDGYSPENDCAPAGMADTDLRTLHYTFLNADYNNEVNNDWTDGGCMEAIKKNLGYRFVMNQGTFPAKVSAGGNLEVVIDLENVGYASPVRKRNVNLILKNTTSGELLTFIFDTDIRTWFSAVDLSGTFEVMATTVPGEYELFLQIADAYPSIAERPEYSIRLANADVWGDVTGYNNLKHTITIE